VLLLLSAGREPERWLDQSHPQGFNLKGPGLNPAAGFNRILAEGIMGEDQGLTVFQQP